MFDKSVEKFPHKKNHTFLAFCSVSPLYAPAANAGQKFLEAQAKDGICLFDQYTELTTRFRKAAGKLLDVDMRDITIPINTSEALNIVANGYPFKPGDEVISFEHEYPANHYPWVLQQKRGVKLKLLQNHKLSNPVLEGKDADGLIGGWSWQELESLVTERTKIIALSHVQFTSAYAADLEKLGEFCKGKNIDLVIDAAQSLGSLPIYPEKYGISAVAASGWKWLIGPIGTGVFYTSAEFREKIEITMSGSDHMEQQAEYLDHSWRPFSDGRKFNYSTLPYACVEGLSTVIEEVFNTYGIEEIQKEIYRMQDFGLKLLNRDKYTPLVHEGVYRAGFISIIPKNGDAKEIHLELKKQGVLITPRDGYLRFAPHFCSTEEEVEKGISILNSL